MSSESRRHVDSRFGQRLRSRFRKDSLSPEERQNKRRTNSQKTLNTANGRMIVDNEATLSAPLLGDGVTALVLDNTTSVLSLGKRYMEQGYEFEWKSGSSPVLITPAGRRIKLGMVGYVPFLPCDDERVDGTANPATVGGSSS